jgi:hypothetical protein
MEGVEEGGGEEEEGRKTFMACAQPRYGNE